MTEQLWVHTADPVMKADLADCAGVLRYLETDPGKHAGLTAEEVEYVHDKGLPLSPIWQEGKTAASLGRLRGVSDASRANAACDRLGFPAAAVWYTVDDNLTVDQVAPYFDGVRSVTGRPVGIYGSRVFCEWAASVGIPYRWQTRAWSGGLISPSAHLYHRDANVPSGMTKVDRDVPYQPFPAWNPPGVKAMAQPLTTNQLLAALKGEGVNLREYPGWRDRCRCHTGSHEKGVGPRKQWGPIVGVIVHHTGGVSANVDQYIENVLINDPAVPLKCQFLVDQDGVCHLLSAGLCNHDLYMSNAAHAALVGETWSLTAPYQDLRGGDMTGSTFAYGIENMATGDPNAKQLDTSARICAAINRAFGWTGGSEAGHGEVAKDRGQYDPGNGVHMGNFRRRVIELVSGKPGGNTTQNDQEDYDMANVPQNEWNDVRDRVRAISAHEDWWETPDDDPNTPVDEGQPNSKGEAIKRIRDTAKSVGDARADIAALNVKVDKLIEELGKPTGNG